MRFFKGEHPPYRGVAYRPDGRTLITATKSGVVTLWDLEAGRELTQLRNKPGLADLDSLTLSPNGRLLAGAGFNLTVWDVEIGAIAVGFDSEDAIRFRGVTFAENGTRLIA